MYGIGVFENVDFQPEINLILYPSLEKLTIHIAIPDKLGEPIVVAYNDGYRCSVQNKNAEALAVGFHPILQIRWNELHFVLPAHNLPLFVRQQRDKVQYNSLS